MIISLGGLTFSIFFSINNIQIQRDQIENEQERAEEFKNLQSLVYSQQFKPRLKIVGTPSITNVLSDTVKISINFMAF